MEFPVSVNINKKERSHNLDFRGKVPITEKFQNESRSLK